MLGLSTEILQKRFCRRLVLFKCLKACFSPVSIPIYPFLSSDAMKDEYLTKRFCDAALAAKIVAHYKRLPTLRTLARQPFVCWMVASVFERWYRHGGYGVHPPRLTPFYINILIVQTNRRLQFYKSTDDNQVMSLSLKLYNIA